CGGAGGFRRTGASPVPTTVEGLGASVGQEPTGCDNELDDLGYALLGGSDCLSWIFVVLELACEIGIVGSQVKVAVATQVKKDYALLSGFLSLAGFFEDGGDGMGGFGGRQDTFMAGEEHGGFEDGFLIVGLSFYDAFLMKLRDQW